MLEILQQALLGRGVQARRDDGKGGIPRLLDCYQATILTQRRSLHGGSSWSISLAVAL